MDLRTKKLYSPYLLIKADQSMTIQGNPIITGATEIQGATTLDANLTVSGTATISTAMVVTGPTTLHGAVDLNHDLTISGTATISTAMVVTGPSTFVGGLTGGNITAGTDLTVGSSLYAVGASTVTNNLFANSLTIGTDATILDDATIGDLLRLERMIMSGSAELTGDFEVHGNCSLDSSVTVGNILTVSNGLTVSGPATLHSDTTISGTVSTGLDLFVAEDLGVRGGGALGFHQVMFRGNNTTQRMDIGGRNSGQFGIGIYRSDDATYGVEIATGTGASYSYFEGRMLIGADAVTRNSGIVPDGQLVVVGYNSNETTQCRVVQLVPSLPESCYIRVAVAATNNGTSDAVQLWSEGVSTNETAHIRGSVIASLENSANATDVVSWQIEGLVSRGNSGGAQLLLNSVTQVYPVTDSSGTIALDISEDNDISLNFYAATGEIWVFNAGFDHIRNDYVA